MPYRPTKKVVTYEATDELPAAKVSPRAKAQARQAALLGADVPAEGTATGVVMQAAAQAKAQAKAAATAKTAMALRALALTAEELRKLPGGGEAADTLLRSLDAAVNKGGEIAVKDNKLVRKKPKPEVGFIFPALLTVAPYAMRAIGPAIAAARAGLSRFGPALLANARTAAAFVSTKVGNLLSAAKASPLYASVASKVKKGLLVAGAALGIGVGAAALTEKGRAKLKEGARRAYRIARTGVEATAEGAKASASEAAAAVTPSWWETVKTWAPYAIGAVVALRVLR